MLATRLWTLQIVVFGNFEQWTQIAALNGLSEPWTGTTNAMPGDQLLIPTATGVAPPVGLPIPSYNNNVLGVDWYFGKSNVAILCGTETFH